MLLLDSRARKNNLGNKGLKVGQQKIAVGFFLPLVWGGETEKREGRVQRCESFDIKVNDQHGGL